MRRANAMFVTLIVLMFVAVIGLVAFTTMTSDGETTSTSTSTSTSRGRASTGWIKDHDEGWRIAERDRRPVIMLFTAAWCPPCRKLKKDVLDTDDVMAAMTESFVLIKVDLSNSGENDEIARHYKVRSIPTIMAFDDEGEFIETFDDARTKGAYLHWLKECGG